MHLAAMLTIAGTAQFWLNVLDAFRTMDGYLAELQARGEARASPADYQHRPPTR